MEGFCLRTHLIEKPCVCFYYKGMEDDNTSPDALNVVVAFTPKDAMYFDKPTALSLCERLNKDSGALKESGYSEFKMIYIIK